MDKQTYNELMMDREFEHKLSMQDEITHREQLASDEDYAIEYTVSKFGLDDAYDKLNKASSYLFELGYRLSPSEILEQL